MKTIPIFSILLLVSYVLRPTLPIYVRDKTETRSKSLATDFNELTKKRLLMSEIQISISFLKLGHTPSKNHSKTKAFSDIS